MILVIGRAQDEHVRPVVAELKRRGERVVVFDLAELPEQARISVTVGPEDVRAVVERAEDPFSLDEVKTIWLRRIGLPAPRVRDHGFALAECHHLLVGLAHSLRAKRWVNPLAALTLDGGWGKVHQLQVAREVGLEIPRTLMTNDPERARAFVASCPGGSIYKAFACPDGLWTTEVNTELASRLNSVAHAPGIFQEKIPKALDLRVTVFGGRFFACGIASQGLEESRLDYRRRCFALPRTAHELPASVCAALVRLHETLGLAFGTCDMVLTPDGRYVFLEVNQAGCFLDVGAAPGVDLLGAFCDFLSKR